MTQRLLPHDIAAERAVLGALLLRSDCWRDILGLVYAEDFYDAIHQVIFEAIAAVVADKEHINLLTVQDKLRQQSQIHKLGAVDGEAYLATISNEVAHWDGIASQARIVRDKAQLRRTIKAADAMMQAGYAGQESSTVLLSGFKRELDVLAEGTLSDDPKHIKTVLGKCIASLQKRKEDPRAVTGIPFGLQDLDEMTSGWQPGEVIVVAGRPGMGKTAFAANAILAATSAGHPVLFDSIEMPDEQIGNRLLCNDGRVDGMLLRTGFLESRDWMRLVGSAQRLVECPLWIDEGPQTLETLSLKTRKWKRNRAAFPKGTELGMLVIDFLQLMGSSDPKAQISRDREVTLIMTGLKALAKELGLPIIVLSQLSRATEKRTNQRPTMGDLRDSGGIEQAADVIVGLYRDEYYNAKTEDKGIAEIILMKQRNGIVGTARARYQPGWTRFEPLSYRGN